jgi:hypothetical protein
VLVDENPDDSSFLEEGGGSLHLLLAVEGGDPPAAAVAVDQVVHERVAQCLVDAARLARFHELGDLGVDFPVSEVAERGDGAASFRLVTDNPVLPG